MSVNSSIPIPTIPVITTIPKNPKIIKYKSFNINNISIDDSIKYDGNSEFYIQTPIIINYNKLKYSDTKYLELFLEKKLNSHNLFLTMIDSLEIKFKNDINKNIKTQIIHDSSNSNSKICLKVKFTDETKIFDSNYNIITELSKNNITLLLKICFYRTHYSWNIIQVLQS